MLVSAILAVAVLPTTASADFWRFDLVPKPATDGSAAGAARAAASEFFVEPDVDVHLTLTGEQPGDGFGWVAESLGDINGDGTADFVVTAPFFITNPSLPSPGGKAYVYSGADGTLLNSVTSPGVPVFGYSAKSAGDVNADGVTDYIVGSFSTAMVFSGATHAVLHIWYRPGEFFGSSVSAAGDLDADGFDDVIVGARYANGDAALSGQVFAYSGRTGEELWRRSGRRAGDELGTAAGWVGDVN
ncbi:MAG: integrin alpha, partial [Pseudomonadota bacterium]